MVVKSDTMHRVLASVDDLPCAADSATSEARDVFEVRLRPAHQSLRRCIITRQKGCAYLDRLRRFTAGASIDEVGDSEVLMQDLDRAMKCPSGLARFWPN